MLGVRHISTYSDIEGKMEKICHFVLWMVITNGTLLTDYRRQAGDLGHITGDRIS